MILSEKQIKQHIIESIGYAIIIKDIKRCLICNKLRINEEMNELQWQSNFILNYYNRTQFFTVCPHCRKTTTIDMCYEALTKRLLKKK